MYQLTVLLALTSVYVNALTITTQVPTPAYKTGRYNFICKYRIDRPETFREAKWLKGDNDQILRCPSTGHVELMDNPFNKIWALAVQNGSCNFVLSNIDKENEGNYTCQVSIGGLYSATQNSTKYIRVEEISESGSITYLSCGISFILFLISVISSSVIM